MTLDNMPHWAWVQNHIGILNLISRWGQETWVDEYGDVRHSLGILHRFRPMACEAWALSNIDKEATVWDNASGRTTLTALEERVWQLDCEYMRRCQTLEFKREFPLLAQVEYIESPQDGDFKENTVDRDKALAWIGSRTYLSKDEIVQILNTVTKVLELREVLGLEGYPEVE